MSLAALPGAPRRVITALYLAAAVVVAAWTVLLAFYVAGPSRVEWLGYNTVLVVAMLAAARATRRAAPAATTLAGVLAALVFADGWFDVTTAPPDYVHWSLLSAAVLEWPFALVCAYVAARGFRPEPPSSSSSTTSSSSESGTAAASRS